MTTTNKKRYNKMDPKDHILHRPDTYVGSTRSRPLEEYVSNPENNFQISKKLITYSPAILRIFIEPLSNAIDNVERSKKTKNPCKNIKINIDIKSGETSIWNDGDSIPVEINEDEGCYNHSLIFGQLLTSSNYDDEEERYNISGRNGIGIKATNVFSSYFSVKGLDPDNGLILSQEWTQNMKLALEPEIEKTKLKKGYTEVSWIPDFKQFKLKGYTRDVIELYCRYVVDTAMLTNVNVYFNDVLVPVKTLTEYSKLYSTVEEKETLTIITKDAQVVIMPSTTSLFQAVSFANGVYTSLGGSHVDSWVEEIFRPIVKKLSKTKGGVTFNLGEIKRYFKIFVVVNVVNPEFESQSKHKLESPVKAQVKKKDIDNILKWSVIEDIIRSKEMVVLKKLERKKKTFVKIEGLDPANNEGGPLSSDCTLLLVEGLSAKTYAVQGIEVGISDKKGRDFNGIYPLRGKLLNVRNSKAASIANNNVISDIIKALNVKHDVDYTDEKNYKTLRYGKIMILTDSDCDGIHISSLIQNLFHNLFPSLLERKKPYITSMQTPIVRVFLDKKQLLFYDEREYKKYVTDFKLKNPNQKINNKYYKGLGSSSSKDIRETFGNKMIEFIKDEDTDFNMNKVFHKKETEARKEWLSNYDPNNVALKWNKDVKETVKLNISDFINTEMIKFSLDDCSRSIPSIMDGLKESHRKIIYACFLKKLKYTGKTLKVAQLAGYVAEKTAYHHGEQNLYDTITKMANEFPGSNNIPLLFRDGQFGSRLNNGKDAANARYIFTKLDCLTRLLFRQEDDILLERNVDDGTIVEPKYYVPILPTVLINGCTAAIGTGWSCSIPCYNPLDLIKSVKVWLDKDGQVLLDEDGVVISLLPELIPWYRDFNGKIEKSGESKFITRGNIRTEKKKKIVDELPIGMWTDKFKDTLDNLQEEKLIGKVRNYSTPKKVNFEITETNDGLLCNETNLKLHTYVYTSNMVLFQDNGILKKFESVDNIIDTFCTIRLKYYVKRKKYYLDLLNVDIQFLGNKRRFLEYVMNGTIKLFDDSGKTKKSRKTEDIYKDLADKKFDKHYKNIKDEEDYDDEENKGDKGYDYLLRLQFRNITEEKLESLKNDILSKTEQRDKLKNTTEKKLWMNDLNEFETAYCKWLKNPNK